MECVEVSTSDGKRRDAAVAEAVNFDFDPLAAATRLRALDPSLIGPLGGSSSSSSSTSDSDSDSTSSSSDDLSDGEMETPADRAGPSVRGALSAHWTRVPLSRQIAACHRRWQLELPLRGAVSLATQHHLQASTSSDDIDATRGQRTVAEAPAPADLASSAPADEETEMKRQERLEKMMASQLSLPPGGGWGEAPHSSFQPPAAGTSSNGGKPGSGDGFTFNSATTGRFFEQFGGAGVGANSPLASPDTNRSPVFKFGAAQADGGGGGGGGSSGGGWAQLSSPAAAVSKQRFAADDVSPGAAGAATGYHPGVPPVPPQTFVFRAGSSSSPSSSPPPPSSSAAGAAAAVLGVPASKSKSASGQM
jgi:hypothetical protein